MRRLIICLLAILMGVQGCLKQTPVPLPAGPAVADVTYHFEAGDDMLSLFAFDASYVDADGRVVTEPITSLPWQRRVKASLPFESEMQVKFTSRTDFPSKSSYDIGYDGNISYAIGNTRAGECVKPAFADDEQVLRLRFTLPDAESADGASLRIAPLKYDKHFAFTMTVDDSYVNAYSRVWSLIHGRWIDDREFWHLGAPRTTGRQPDAPLVMTDGCGNDRFFGFSCALWPTWGNNYNTTFIKEAAATGANSQYISWEELALLSDFGVSMCYHNVDERLWGDKDPRQIAQGFEADYQKVYEKLGVEMKVLGLPDGKESYIEAAKISDRVAFVRSSRHAADKIWLHRCGDLYKQMTYGGVGSSDIAKKLAELAEQSASADPYWVGLTVHRPQEDYMEMLEAIYKLYGKQGADNLWVASWDEVYEYVALREGCQIDKQVDGSTVNFEIRLPKTTGFLFSELTLLVDGVCGAAVEAVSDQIVGVTHAERDQTMLVNICFGNRPLLLAEKYTAKYEAAPSNEALSDAQYFVSQLLPELSRPFEERLAQAGGPVLPDEEPVPEDQIREYLKSLDGHVFRLQKTIVSDVK